MVNKSIKVVFFDIDGVLTDGAVYINQDGTETKKINLTEIDAIGSIRDMGIEVVAISGEKTAIVDVFKDKVKWKTFEKGCKDKLSKLIEIEKKYGIENKEMCYIGDGKYDIDPIKYVGLGVCPDNAIQEVKDVADIVLEGKGGESCIYELYQLLKRMKKEDR